MRTGLLALGIAAGVAACGPALAQAIPTVNNQRELKIIPTLNVTYDTNVGRTSEAISRLRGINPEDEIVNPSLVFDVVQPIGRQAAFLQGFAGYDYHAENRILNHVNADVSGGGLFTLGPCHTTGYGQFTAVQTDLQNASLAITKNLSQTATGGGQVVCGQQRGFNAQLMGAYTDVVNSETLQKVSDRRGNNISLQVGYGNNTWGNIGLVGTYTEQKFPSRQNFDGTFGDSYWSELLGVNYQKQFGQKIRVQAQVGQNVLKRSQATPGFPQKIRETNYSAVVDYKMSSRLEFLVQGGRQFQPSNRPGKLVDLVTRVDGSGAYNLGTRITVTLAGFWEDMQANQDTSANALPTITTSTRTGESLSVRYQQSQRITGTLDVRHEDRDTDLSVFNYSDTRVTLTLSSSF
jgi:hypothetical protein